MDGSSSMANGDYVQITLQVRVRIGDEAAMQALGPLATEVDGELRVFELSGADVLAQRLLNHAGMVVGQTPGVGGPPSLNYTLQHPENGVFAAFEVPELPVPEF